MTADRFLIIAVEALLCVCAIVAIIVLPGLAYVAARALYSRGKAIEARRHRTAQADEIALSMQFGGASDFHDFPLRTNLEQDRAQR
jgi:hypothetical protein